MNTPLISVLMPSLNVAPYIRQCIESVVNQTLKDIEVICIDAGSTDGTFEILSEYAKADERVRIITSDVKSYGHQMNMGLKAARGRYIGIVETDDFADLDMFEVLYREAVAHDAQVVKANYFDYRSQPIEKSVFHERYKGLPYGTILSDAERVDLLEGGASIWTGIYDREFLLENAIDFLETPGASFQDTAFILKVWIAAHRVVLVHDAYLHYRNDNAGSSVHSSGKTYCVCEEMASARAYMNQRQDWHDMFCHAMWGKLVSSYIWNYRRLPDETRLEFLMRMNEELREARDLGELDMDAVNPGHRKLTQEILDDPEGYYAKHRGESKKDGSPAPQPAQDAGGVTQAGGSDAELADGDPLVSVIITTYNTKEYVVECLEGVLNQTYGNFEVIIVDDGSKDKTIATIEKAFPHDGRIRIYAMGHENAGVQRNVGMRYARGTYYQFLDADDRFPLTMLESLVRKAQATEADVICCGSRNFMDGTDTYRTVRQVPRVEDYDVAYPPTFFGESLYTSFMGWAWDKLFLREFVEGTGLEFQSLTSTNDAYFVFCALALAKRIALVDEVLPEHRLHAGSIETRRQSYPHNAYRAYEAIEKRLEHEPVWDVVEKAAKTWSLGHLRWNYQSLKLPEKLDAFDDYRTMLFDVQAQWPDSLDEADREILETMSTLDAGRLMVEVEDERKQIEHLEKKVSKLQDDLKKTKAELGRVSDDFGAVVGSKSFKVGRTLTALPRRLRDVLLRR